MAGPFKNQTILKILDYYKNIWALNHVAGIAHWDLETYMPAKGAVARGEALAKISTLSQKIFLDNDFVALIHEAENQKDLNDAEKGVVRMLTRALKFYTKLPPSFLEEFEKLIATATVVWRGAKDNNDYKLFEPYLGRIFEMNKKAAEYLGYKDSPYDALLDEYEEGLTSAEVGKFFNDIRDPLKKLLTQIVKSGKHNNDHVLENLAYNKEKLMKLNEKILSLFWADFGRFRIDISAHPFTTSFANTDTRVTTWYHTHDFARSVLATVHEFGHALYELQCDDALQMTPVGAGTSLVIHESQSRFWENFVGRSNEFINHFLPDFSDAVGRKLAEPEVYSYFNKVEPSPLRVEADEVTYHFHIMLRFEIEKAMIEGSMKISDIRDAWNARMQEYLGITPKNDSEGVLQDIHWSGGTVGYFPTYSMGTFLGAQWEAAVKNLKPDDYEGIKSWLKDHIHKYGSTYTLKDLLNKNSMQFDPQVNIKYLFDKYSKIYGF